MSLRKTELVLPSYLAGYLVNGDDSGIESHELKECDRFLAAHHLSAGACASCGEEYFSRYNDFDSLAGNVCEFLFLT